MTTLKQAWMIRPMSVSDYDAAFRFWASIVGLRLSATDFRAGLAALIEHQARLSHVAVCDGEMVGTAMCGEDGQVGYINQIVVAPEFREEGLERALLEHCLAGFQANGLSECRFGYGVAEAEVRESWCS